MAIAKRFHPETDEDPWDTDSTMMTWASAILLAVIFLIVLGVAIIWLTVHPRQLKYAVEDAFLSNFTLTPGRLVAADFDISMSAYNPNHRVSFSYGPMKVSVKSDGHTLASTYRPPSFHDKDHLTNFTVNLTSHDVALPEYTWNKLKDQKPSGDIKIDVIIEVSVKFKPRHWKQDHCTIWIFCAEVMAHFSRQKTFLKETPCNVEL